MWTSQLHRNRLPMPKSRQREIELTNLIDADTRELERPGLTTAERRTIERRRAQNVVEVQNLVRVRKDNKARSR